MELGRFPTSVLMAALSLGSATHRLMGQVLPFHHGSSNAPAAGAAGQTSKAPGVPTLETLAGAPQPDALTLARQALPPEVNVAPPILKVDPRELVAQQAGFVAQLQDGLKRFSEAASDKLSRPAGNQLAANVIVSEAASRLDAAVERFEARSTEMPDLSARVGKQMVTYRGKPYALGAEKDQVSYQQGEKLYYDQGFTAERTLNAFRKGSVVAEVLTQHDAGLASNPAAYPATVSLTGVLAQEVQNISAALKDVAIPAPAAPASPSAVTAQAPVRSGNGGIATSVGIPSADASRKPSAIPDNSYSAEFGTAPSRPASSQPVRATVPAGLITHIPKGRADYTANIDLLKGPSSYQGTVEGSGTAETFNMRVSDSAKGVVAWTMRKLVGTVTITTDRTTDRMDYTNFMTPTPLPVMAKDLNGLHLGQLDQAPAVSKGPVTVNGIQATHYEIVPSQPGAPNKSGYTGELDVTSTGIIVGAKGKLADGTPFVGKLSNLRTPRQ